MARLLDSELQRIIENAGSGYYQSGEIQSSMTLGGFTSPASNRLSNSYHPRDEFRFLPIRHRTEAYIPDGIDRIGLQSGGASQDRESDNGFSRVSLPHIATYSQAGPVQAVPQFIYGHQISRPQLFGEETHVRGFLAAPWRERHQSHRTSISEPRTIFSRFERSSSPQMGLPDPVTPRSISSYAYTPPVQAKRAHPPAHDMSSPSNRFSLRRTSNRSAPLVVADERQLSSDGETLPYRTESLKIRDFSNKAGEEMGPSIGPLIAHGIQLVSPHELPDQFRVIFSYQLFNAVQSKCFPAAYKTNDNMVIAAPTGSGKTAILELAICKLVQDYGSDQFKIVYQAPTKSLCAERMRDWQRKFSHLNLPCAELTGDTDAIEMSKVGSAAIIITTPEKWDSITRKWKDYIKLLQLVKLFLIDEVHILKDPRGATLEAVVSRMKSIGASIRFLALSATVPNSQDIAMWLGKDHTNGHLPAHRETFGEDFRPVQLQKHVYGFSSNINDFAFESSLDAKMPALILKHTKCKPMMVFCFTRKSCEQAAAKLAEWWSSLRATERPWPTPKKKIVTGTQELHGLLSCGVAFHHAGLDVQDRNAIEMGFLAEQISVICCTSTLAVGINLPCHLVVIKGTVCYTEAGVAEYSDLEVMQMLGRAGRPQFDSSAVAIIMTRSENVDRYKKMMSGQDILESTLHLNLIEHLNSEISLGTVHDVYSAKCWLSGTFLSVRMRLNPSYYKFSCDKGTRDADEKLERVCERDVELLQRNKLITTEQRMSCTEYGKAMSKYMVQFETMKLLLSIPKHAKVAQIAAEFKDLRLKPNERASFREFNKSPFIRYPVKENITNFAHKVSLIIQVQLGGVDHPMNKEFNGIKRQFMAEKLVIFDRVQRLVRCVVECKAYDCDAVATCNALELARGLSAGFWEDSVLQLQQIPNIGPAAVRKLAQSNVKTISQLAAMGPAGIERVMSRNPPFGMKILKVLAEFPRLTLKAKIMKKIVKLGEQVRVQVKTYLGFSNIKSPSWVRTGLFITFTASVSNGTLAHIWRGPIQRLEKGFELTFTCTLTDCDDRIICQISCEELVGTVQSVLLDSGIPVSAFPSSKAINTIEGPVGIKDDDKSESKLDEYFERQTAIDSNRNNPSAGHGSDYGEEYLSEDFMDIENFEEIALTHGGAPEDSNTERIRMENGKYQCNHRCRDNTKNGVSCKHKCCQEGLNKWRKAPKKKPKIDLSDQAAQKSKDQGVNSSAKRTSLEIPKPKFKLAGYGEYFGDIEELDLAEELLPIGKVHRVPLNDASCQGADSHSKNFSSPNLPMNVSMLDLDHSQPCSPQSEGDNDEYGSDAEFPSPSKLLGIAEPLNDKDSLGIELSLSNAQTDQPQAGEMAPGVDQEHGMTSLDPIDFNESAHDETKSGKKRAVSPASDEPEAKYRRLDGLEGMIIETTRPLPDWVNEFDPDIVAYFRDFVEFV